LAHGRKNTIIEEAYTIFLQILAWSMLQTIVHYSLHFLAPAGLSMLFFRRIWLKAYMIMLLTMAVDLDHLLADPLFDPDRCSIGFHPLHSWWAILGYTFMLLIPRRFIHIRIVGLGLLFHMFTDFIDCLWMFSKCYACCDNSAFSWLCPWWFS
jgi:hypothetical protein